MRINTNVSSMIAIENGTANNKTANSSLEKLSSGLRINKSSDDASGMAIADKLRTQKTSLIQSTHNANSAIALIQIADKAMSEQSNILDIIKTKLLQSATSTTSSAGRQAVAKDINKLLIQFDQIGDQTNYNGMNLLQEKDGGITGSLIFMIGETKNDTISTSGQIRSNTAGYATNNGFDTLEKLKLRTEGDGLLLTVDKSRDFLNTVDISIEELNSWRADFGSTQNQIESSLRNISTAVTNIAAAESVIRDVDYAAESAKFNKHSIIGNASTYAQSQANALPDDVLKLLN